MEHHPQSSFYKNRPMSLHEPKPPSMWKEGDRLRWRMENSLAHESTLHACVYATLHCLANQPDPPAITHHWRGPPSFRERGLFFVALLCQSIVRFVAVLCQSAGPAGYHPPLTRSPLFQRKRAYLRCVPSIVPFSSPSPVFFPSEYDIEQTLLICLHCWV